MENLGRLSRVFAVPLTSASLPFAHGPSALWKKPNENLLMCEHNADSHSAFSALLWAFVDIIPHSLFFEFNNFLTDTFPKFYFS